MPDPIPVPEALDRRLREGLRQIPAGKRGQLSAAITTSGLEAGLGWQVKKSVTVSGWAGREWGASGWSAGVRTAIVW